MAGNLTSCCTTARKPQERSHGSHFTPPDAGSDRCRRPLDDNHNCECANRAVPVQAGGRGVARAATELPPGEKVTYHNPKDVADMPDFHFSLDASRPKVTSGGWAKEATVHQFPISKGLAGVHMFLDPGAVRELHWHAIAAEWAYVIDCRCQTVVLDPSGASEINNYGPGDLWFFPKGHGHSIQTIGDKPCHFVLSFDNGGFSEHGTFSITDWIDVTPKDMLALNFRVPKDAFHAFPNGEAYIQAAPLLPGARTLTPAPPQASRHPL